MSLKFKENKSIFLSVGKSIWKKLPVFFRNVLITTKNIGRFIVEKISSILKILKKWEKILIISLLLVIVISSLCLIYSNYLKNTHITQNYGGSYIEGIVGDNKAEIDQAIQKLTKIGLTYYDENNALQPAIAEKWEISDDGKTYTFYLKDKTDSGKIAETINSHKNEWNDIQIETPDSKTIKFILKDSYSPFLAKTAQPIFEYGPYKIDKQVNFEITFLKNPDFVLDKPYLENIVLKIYPDEENLAKGYAQGKIMGMAETINGDFKSLNIYNMPLPRYEIVFFNLNREQFQNKEVRQKIKNNEKLGNEIKATLVTSNKEKNIARAEELKSKWDSLGLKIEIKTYDPMELQKEILPNRNYDMLLYGIDYGYDPDPYPFWHTSQMISSGLNLSNFSNQKADGFLEEGRKTIDQNVRNEKYQEFQKVLDDEVPAIFLNQDIWKYSVSSKIKGVKDHNGITPADRFNEIWKWYTNERRVKN